MKVDDRPPWLWGKSQWTLDRLQRIDPKLARIRGPRIFHEWGLCNDESRSYTLTLAGKQWDGFQDAFTALKKTGLPLPFSGDATQDIHSLYLFHMWAHLFYQIDSMRPPYAWGSESSISFKEGLKQILVYPQLRPLHYLERQTLARVAQLLGVEIPSLDKLLESVTVVKSGIVRSVAPLGSLAPPRQHLDTKTLRHLAKMSDWAKVFDERQHSMILPTMSEFLKIVDLKFEGFENTSNEKIGWWKPPRGQK